MKAFNVGNRIMNTYVYKTQNGYVMIDTGYENSLRDVEKKLLRHNIALSEIKYVFLTHAHDDHAGFLNELLTVCPHIKVFASTKALPTLKKGQNSFNGGCSGLLPLAFCNFMKLLGKGEHKFPKISEQNLGKFIFIDDNNIGNIEKVLGGKILVTPGHTADSMSLKIDKIVFCGDAAMNGFPSLHRITIWVENKTDFYNSWNILFSENIKTVIPAHGKPFDINDLKKYQKHISSVTLHPLK